MKRSLLCCMALQVLMWLMLPSSVVAGPPSEPIVQVVFFYSPDCPHCHQASIEVLGPMLDQYGERLQVLGVDVSQSAGSTFYQAVVQHYDVPFYRRGVPTIVVGESLLVGRVEIADEFPVLVSRYLAADGAQWPDLPSLAQLLTDVADQAWYTAPTPAATDCEPSAGEDICGPNSTPAWPALLQPTPVGADAGQQEAWLAEDRSSARDIPGFTLAGAVLAALVTGIGYSARQLARPRGRRTIFQLLTSNPGLGARVHAWLVPSLCLLGLAVSGYLAHVELLHVEAVCGPVGDCNVVQTSAYALFLGVPVAVWGIIYYAAVSVLWAGNRCLRGRLADWSLLGLLGLTLFGALFSVYLTCLELFAIRAICTWCLTSAVLTVALLLLTVIPVTFERDASPELSGARP